jgi:hypothetical protein
MVSSRAACTSSVTASRAGSWRSAETASSRRTARSKAHRRAFADRRAATPEWVSGAPHFDALRSRLPRRTAIRRRDGVSDAGELD